MSVLARRALAHCLVLALLAASCGSGDDTETAVSGVSTSSSQGGDTTAATDGTDPSNTDAEPGTIDENRIAHGTGGFTIDLNACPSDWSNTEGITDDEIRLAHSFVFSGTLAAYGAISEAMGAYFEWSAEQNPEAFGGRNITLEVKDDAYEPARVVANTEELVESASPFAIPGMAGTPGNLAIYDFLNEQCIPHLFPGTGHPAFGDPVNHPWSTMNYLAYSTEGGIWGQYILDLVDAGELPRPARVAFLQANNDFGKAWDLGLKSFVEDHPDDIEIVSQELFETSAPNITNEVTTLLASDPDVFIGGVVGVSCTQVLGEVAQSAFDPQVKIQGSVCSGLSFWTAAGEAGDGWVIVVDRKDIADAKWDDDPFIVEMRAMLDDKGVEWRTNSNAGNGLLFAAPVVETLVRAGELPGGLTRTNAMIAAYALDWEHPYGLPGNRWVTDGLEDAFPSEQAQFLRYIADGDSGTFEEVGELVDLSGTTPLCAWDGARCN